MNTAEIIDALKKRYPLPEYAFFTEVRDATGSLQRRSADGLAVGCYPSRGLEIIGFEVKADRRDWLREKKAPEKAESICRFCDRWYLVVGDEKIVQEGELPATWGLLIPKGAGLRERVAAPKLEAQPITRPFLAALLRNAQQNDPGEARLKAERRKGYEEAQESLAEHHQTALKNAMSEVDQTRETIRVFEEASGIRIDRWNSYRMGNVGAVVRLLSDRDGLKGIAQRFSELRSMTRAALAQLDELARLAEVAATAPAVEARTEGAAAE